MPLTNSTTFNGDMPAIWLLNAHIPLTSQYGTNAECSWYVRCDTIYLFSVPQHVPPVLLLEQEAHLIFWSHLVAQVNCLKGNTLTFQPSTAGRLDVANSISSRFSTLGTFAANRHCTWHQPEEAVIGFDALLAEALRLQW